MRSTFSACLPTAGKVVPATPNWLHEVKYDGYRLIVVRDGDRVRLFTRNGHDWSGRFPWIVEAALKNRHNRHSQFVIDGEAVVLGIDGIRRGAPSDAFGFTWESTRIDLSNVQCCAMTLVWVSTRSALALRGLSRLLFTSWRVVSVRGV